jgi:hypothetical protein
MHYDTVDRNSRSLTGSLIGDAIYLIAASGDTVEQRQAGITVAARYGSTDKVKINNASPAAMTGSIFNDGWITDQPNNTGLNRDPSRNKICK